VAREELEEEVYEVKFEVKVVNEIDYPDRELTTLVADDIVLAAAELRRAYRNAIRLGVIPKGHALVVRISEADDNEGRRPL
jgi:hypothetical protein